MASQVRSIIQSGEPLVNYSVRFNGNNIQNNLMSFKAKIDPVNNKGEITLTLTVTDLSEFYVVYQDLKSQLS